VGPAPFDDSGEGPEFITMSDHSADSVPAITVFLADDNLLVREG